MHVVSMICSQPAVGTASSEAMADKVRESQLVISCMSPQFFKSKWCKKEIDAAADAGVKVISVFSGDYTSNAQMEAWIGGNFD